MLAGDDATALPQATVLVGPNSTLQESLGFQRQRLLKLEIETRPQLSSQGIQNKSLQARHSENQAVCTASIDAKELSIFRFDGKRILTQGR